MDLSRQKFGIIAEVTKESIEQNTAEGTEEDHQIPTVVELSHQERLAQLAESHNKNRALQSCISDKDQYLPSDYGSLFELRKDKNTLQDFLYYSEDKQVQNFLS